MAGKGRMPHGRCSFIGKSQLPRKRPHSRHSAIKSPRAQNDYFMAKLQVRAQETTIRDLQKQLAEQNRELEDNDQLIESLKAAEAQCSQLQQDLRTTTIRLINTQDTLELAQDQLDDTAAKLERLQEHAEEQETRSFAAEAENAALTLQLREAKRKVDFVNRILCSERQALAATKTELTGCQAQLAATTKSRENLSGVLAKTRASAVGSLTAALAIAPIWGDPVVDFVMWLLLLVKHLVFVPMATLITLAFTATAITIMYSVSYSPIILACLGEAASIAWSIGGSRVGVYMALIAQAITAFPSQLCTLLLSPANRTFSACASGRCSQDSPANVAAAASLGSRLVGYISSSDNSTASSRQVSRLASFVKRDVASSTGGSNSSSRHESVPDSCNDDMEAACDVVVQIQIGAVCKKAVNDIADEVQSAQPELLC